MDDARLRPREHLRGDGTFERIRRRGLSAGDEVLYVRGMANDLGHARLGLAVGRSSGNAVRRARLRRMIREAFRLNKGRLPAGLDLLVSPRSGAADAKPDALGRSLAELSARVAGKLKETGLK